MPTPPGCAKRSAKLLASGEATLRHTLAMPARSGQRAKTSSGSEWIYGIEGDPPELPQTVAGPIGAGIDMISEHSYTAFETGNTGVTFEAEVTGRIEHGGRIPVKMAVEWTRYIRTVEIAEGESMGFQPVFFTQALGLDTILWHGRPALAGVVREVPLVRAPAWNPPPSISSPSSGRPSAAFREGDRSRRPRPPRCWRSAWKSSRRTTP
ncbi:MAG: hypothetical protein R3F11_19870 [Verrucomicrobiales bacterium]